jgi:hypothetical protein
MIKLFYGNSCCLNAQSAQLIVCSVDTAPGTITTFLYDMAEQKCQDKLSSGNLVNSATGAGNPRTGGKLGYGYCAAICG